MQPFMCLRGRNTHRRVPRGNALRRGGLLQLDLLLQPRVAVPRVPPRAQPPGAHLRVHLLHHLSEIGRRQRLQVVDIAVLSVGNEELHKEHYKIILSESPYSHVLVVHFVFWQRNLGVFLQMSLDPGYRELDLGPASEGIDRSAMVNQVQGAIFVATNISVSLLSEWITLHVS